MTLNLTMRDDEIPPHRAAYNRAYNARLALEATIRRNGRADPLQWMEYDALLRLSDAEADLKAIRRNMEKAA